MGPVLYQLSHLCALFGAFSLFTFKLIIAMSVPIAILLIVLDLFLYIFSPYFDLFSFDLMTILVF